MTLTLADKIDPVAIYAAFVSTIVLCWQIFVWWRTGPHLKIWAKASANIPDNGKRFILLEVENVGTQKTTITAVVIFAYRNRWARFRRDYTYAGGVTKSKPPKYKLPFVLEPGGTFVSISPHDEFLENLAREGLLFVGVRYVSGRRALLARVRPIPESEDDRIDDFFEEVGQ